MSLAKPEKKLLLLGGSGFIGNALGEHLARQGWSIHLLTRNPAEFQTAFPCRLFVWDGTTIPRESLESVDAVINLAGQGIADRPWTTDYRKSILDSRVLSTRALAQALHKLDKKPPVVIQASAIGYYGMKPRPHTCDESASLGDDFLAEVSSAWERETAGIPSQIRLVIPRIGVVLGWEGAALAKLWDLYASGVGGILGGGDQWMNWIHLEDVIRFFSCALESEAFHGVYNLVAPQNVTNRSLHEVLASHTPSLSFMRVPALSLRAVMGSRSDLLLTAPQVVPKRLSETKEFAFQYPDLSSAMTALIGERTHPRAHCLKVKQWVPAPLGEVWEFVSQASNLERITPHWLGFRIRHMTTPEIQLGTGITYSLKLHGLPVTWRSRISKWQPQVEFVDEQEKGPYSLWYHRHFFSELAGGTLMEDRVDYSIPLFPFGEAALPLVKKDLHTIFSFRKKTIATILGTQSHAHKSS